jgi:outer membrane immunogenic protein
MKKILATNGLMLFCILAFAQYPLQKDENQLNAGLGFSTWGVPGYIGFDHGIDTDFSIGLEASFRNYHERWHENKYDHTVFGFAGNCNYHFNHIFEMPSSPWDLYAGLTVGFYLWTSPNAYEGSHASGLGLAAQAGMRYYFSSRAAINLEVGGGSFSGGKIGVTIKL